jgi:hypothetical protein
LEGKTMTAIAATAIVALLVVVALARLADIVADAVAFGRSYVASRPAHRSRHAVLLTSDAG